MWHIDDSVAIATSTLTAAQPVIDRADAVLVTFEMPFGPLHDLVRAGREAGARVVVQPAPVYYDPALARTLPWDCVDVLVPNQDEARALLAGPGAAEVPAGELARDVACEWARRAEDLGFDVVWMFDHFETYPARNDDLVLEAWTTLAELSQVTERVVLGTMVSCASYRPAGVAVEMAQNLQLLSGGRFCFGVGAGWDEAEFESLGVRFGSAGERSDRLEELLAASRVADLGKSLRPLVLVGGDGEKRTLPSAVNHADVVNWQVGRQDFARKSRVLARLCADAGRDPASLRRTHAPNFQLFDSEREFKLWREHPDRGMSAAEVDAYIRDPGAFYGTASSIAETIEEYVGLGCSGFMVYCNATPDVGALLQLSGLLADPISRVLQTCVEPDQALG